MNRCRDDLTLSEALSDPLIRAVMKADGVNAQELGAMLRGVADNLRAVAGQWPGTPFWRTGQELIPVG